MLKELGAFGLKSDALALKDRISAGINKKVIIVFEGGYYKIRLIEIPIIDQTVLEEIKKLESSIDKLGLKDKWISPPKTQYEKEPPVVQPESTLKPIEWKRTVHDLFKPETTRRMAERDQVTPVLLLSRQNNSRITLKREEKISSF